MSSGADLFVVCKQCGSEVSPYITECPYCGHRVRRRAPKLPRERGARRSRRSHVSMPWPSRLRRGESAALPSDWPPYATIALVAVSCGVWVAWNGGFVDLQELRIEGPLRGDWWRLLTSLFAYESGLFQFATLVAVAIFGWLLERRHGPAVVLALFLAVGVAGGLVAEAVYSQPLVSGGAAAALGLLAAWVVPDLEAVRTRGYYDGDLLGTGALAAVLLAMPLARPEANWLAVLAGGVLGLVLGLGLSRIGRA
jgi:Rhomboid family